MRLVHRIQPVRRLAAWLHGNEPAAPLDPYTEALRAARRRRQAAIRRSLARAPHSASVPAPQRRGGAR